VFAALTNGGFEQGRADSTPFAWHKFGGELRRTTRFRSEGDYAAAFTSRTTSVKWIYERVSVQPGRYYELTAMVLKDSPEAQEVYLSVLWYASADGSGSNVGRGESTTRLVGESSSFRPLTTAPLLAPEAARSAKLRLMLRPRSAAAVTVYFDAVAFGETAPTSSLSAADTPAWPESAPSAVEGAQREPISLVNTRSAAEGPSPRPSAGEGSDLALASGLGFALGLTGLVVTWRGYRWWRSRAGGRSP
jgi:hypothetical protein